MLAMYNIPFWFKLRMNTLADLAIVAVLVWTFAWQILISGGSIYGIV